jgi:hypothetical protein
LTIVIVTKDVGHDRHEEHALALLRRQTFDFRKASGAFCFEKISVFGEQAGRAQDLTVAWIERVETRELRRDRSVKSLVHIVRVVRLQRVLVMELPIPLQVR